MLHVYLYDHSFEELRQKATIDMSKIPTDRLADECDNIVQHHKACILFFGYLDVGWMLDPKHEARIRNAVRKFEVHMITFHIESIPHAWKNEIDTMYVKTIKHGCTKAIDDGSVVHTQPKTEN